METEQPVYSAFNIALDKKIKEQAVRIRGLIADGLATEDAIQHVREQSCLGAGPWARILELVNA